MTTASFPCIRSNMQRLYSTLYPTTLILYCFESTRKLGMAQENRLKKGKFHLFSLTLLFRFLIAYSESKSLRINGVSWHNRWALYGKIQPSKRTFNVPPLDGPISLPPFLHQDAPCASFFSNGITLKLWPRQRPSLDVDRHSISAEISYKSCNATNLAR